MRLAVSSTLFGLGCQAVECLNWSRCQRAKWLPLIRIDGDALISAIQLVPQRRVFGGKVIYRIVAAFTCIGRKIELGPKGNGKRIRDGFGVSKLTNRGKNEIVSTSLLELPVAYACRLQ